MLQTYKACCYDTAAVVELTKHSWAHIRRRPDVWLASDPSSICFLQACNSILFWGVPLLVKAAVFTAYALMGNRLLPDIAFPALSLLDQLSLPLFFLPDQIGAVVQGRVSLARLQAFLDQPEAQQPALQPAAPEGSPAVSVKQGVFAWAPGDPVCRRQMRVQWTWRHACALACMSSGPPLK